MTTARKTLPPQSEKLLAELCLDRATGNDVCGWAVAALEAGFDTESLRILASMSSDKAVSFFDVQPYLHTALAEFDLPERLDREATLRNYARALAMDIATDCIAASSALSLMHSCVVSPLGHPADLMGWCYLWEGYSADGLFAEMSDDEIENATREYAIKWLGESVE
ncbi:MAG: hypothetical protein ABL891_17860 [Burkholderiales bacterium]